MSGSSLYTICTGTKVDRIQIVFKNGILISFFLHLNGKILFLEFTCETFKLGRFTGPVGENMIFKQLLGDRAGTFRKITACESFYACAENPSDIDTIMFIKSFILDSNHCMLQFYRNLFQGYRQSVGIGSSQFTDLIALIIVEKCCIT